MGLPLNPQPSPSPPPPRPTAASLPPAALDLATKLFNLARRGETSLLTPYITAGIPPNLTNGTGDTLLMLAAYHGHADTVRMLLERGADADALNDRGQSPLAGAVFKGWDEVVGVLVAAGADVHAGRPSAVETAGVFRRGEYLRLFGVGEGEGVEEGVGS